MTPVRPNRRRANLCSTRKSSSETTAGMDNRNERIRFPGYRLPLLPVLATGLLFWAALPPLAWWPLGWLAPFGLLWLIADHEPWPVRHPYWTIWLGSTIYWIVVMQGIRLAHWANYFGLVALAAYLGIYWPLFVAIARRAVHRWRIPLVVAAPVVWTGVEVTRGYGPLGFSMALLAHTQTSRLTLIQMSDLGGAYTVSFVVMLVAAGLFNMLPLANRRWRLWPIFPALAVLGTSLLYGRMRLQERPPVNNRPPIRVALIQGSIDTVFDDDPDAPRRMLDQYSRLTEQAVQKYQPLDLVVWPESMFPINDVILKPNTKIQLDAMMRRSDIELNQSAFQQLTRNMIARLNRPSVTPAATPRRPTSWLLGTTTWQFGAHPPYRYNAAILFDSKARIVTRYYKMHPVMFGEYVPFGDVFPWLYRLMPMPNGLTPGRHARAMPVAGLVFSPSICFESTIPHLIRWQVDQLVRRGTPPDVLVNLTNDGWFWGSSILDMHLDCAIFRAVEMRRPMLVAANTGLSAWIDDNGRVCQRGPRRKCDTLLAEVKPNHRSSTYVRWGDLPAGCCTLFCVLVALGAFVERLAKSRRRS